MKGVHEEPSSRPGEGLFVGVRGLETALARLLDQRMGRRWRASSTGGGTALALACSTGGGQRPAAARMSEPRASRRVAAEIRAASTASVWSGLSLASSTGTMTSR